MDSEGFLHKKDSYHADRSPFVLLVGCDNVAHVVHARLGALGHESGCINRTDRENLAGQSSVLNLDDLIAAAEQHAVLTLSLIHI